MPGQRPTIAPPSTYAREVLKDDEGNVILEVGHDDYMVVLPNRPIEQHEVSTSIMLMCGSMWNPGDENVQLGVCHDCRRPGFHWLRREKPRHGLVSLRAARLCTCGKLLCPRHRTWCEWDRKWRCRSCMKGFRVRRFFQAIFCTTEEG